MYNINGCMGDGCMHVPVCIYASMFASMLVKLQFTCISDVIDLYPDTAALGFIESVEQENITHLTSPTFRVKVKVRYLYILVIIMPGSFREAWVSLRDNYNGVGAYQG